MSQLLVARSICDGVPHDFGAKEQPKNFSLLHSNLWSDLKQLSFQSNDVVAFEVTSSSHDNCKGMFLNLAREHEGLVFYRIVFEKPEAVPIELNNDLGIIGRFPTFAFTYFSNEGLEVVKFEGEAEIDAAIQGGMVDDKITHLLERRAVHKIARLQSCCRPHPPALDPQFSDVKVRELVSRVEELVNQKRDLEEAMMSVRGSVHEDAATLEGTQDHVLIQKADTTELGRDVPLPQPVECGRGTADLTAPGEQDGEEEEEGHDGVESSLVLECLPDKLRAKISSLVEAVQEQKKASKKSSCAVYDSQLLDIVLECDKSTRTPVIKYLSSMMEVTCKTLYRRTKISERKKKLHDSLEKLHEAVLEVMPEQMSLYEEALAARQSGKGPMYKNFKKRFRWSDKTRALLCDVVAVKLEIESKSLITKDKLAQFLEDKVLPFWPKGWMLKSHLLRQSRSVHNQLFAVTEGKGKLSRPLQIPSLSLASAKKWKSPVSSSPVHTSKSGTGPKSSPGSTPSTPSASSGWPPDLTLCEPLPSSTFQLH
ncbi:hypothetical protein EMCRGX_G015845 [Ephydatia muelleri]